MFIVFAECSLHAPNTPAKVLLIAPGQGFTSGASGKSYASRDGCKSQSQQSHDTAAAPTPKQ